MAKSLSAGENGILVGFAKKNRISREFCLIAEAKGNIACLQDEMKGEWKRRFFQQSKHPSFSPPSWRRREQRRKSKLNPEIRQVPGGAKGRWIYDL